MKRTGKAFCIVCATAIVFVASLLIIFPSGPFVRQLLRLIGVGALALALWRYTSVPSRAGASVLLAAWTFLAGGYAVNLWYFTTASGGTLLNPVFNNIDASVVWSQLSALCNGVEPSYGQWQLGYAKLLYLWSLGAAPDVGGVLMLSTLSAMLAIVFSGAAAAKAVLGASPDNSHEAARVSATAMGAMACMCYFMSSGCLIIKDAFVCMIMSAAVYAFVTLRRQTVWACCIGLTAILFAGTMARPHLPAFFAVLALCSFAFVPRRLMAVPAVFFAAALALEYYGRTTGAASEIFFDDNTINFVTGHPDESRIAAYETVAPQYYSTTTLQRLIRLPFCLAVQFFTPLPWAFMRHVVFGPVQFWSHMALPWYAFGGVFLYYLIFCLRQSTRTVASLAVFAAVAYMATAYVTGGTVSRYCLPWLPAMLPAVAYVLTSSQLRSHRFKVWAWCFAAAVALGLVIIYIFVHKYSPEGWMAR